MRVLLFAFALLAPLALAACGDTNKKTVIVNPPANSTVIVPQSSGDAVPGCQPGESSC